MLDPRASGGGKRSHAFPSVSLIPGGSVAIRNGYAFTAVFVQEVERVLRPGGRLILVTDVADYMAMARETLLWISPHFLQEAEAPGQHEPHARSGLPDEF
jgi:SAM-dependent methyltransferase